MWVLTSRVALIMGNDGVVIALPMNQVLTMEIPSPCGAR